MKKSDLLIEILSWIAIIMIIGFFVWINWEMKIESGDGMSIAEKETVRNPITERL